MIEVKTLTHTSRMFATELSVLDFFRIVLYSSYRGDKGRIPWYYTIIRGSSCVTDLRASADEILASMKSNTRNEIRRAIREGCEFRIEESLDDFVQFYNAFCKSKNLDDYTNKARIQKYEKVLITKAVHGDNVLAMHANILDGRSRTALLLFSCSQRLDEGVDRKMIGWGNRFLHFKDLEYLKSLGFETYDWSGICLDPNDERYSIGQFKLAFGGRIVDSWSLKTPLYAMLEHARNLLVRFRR